MDRCTVSFVIIVPGAGQSGEDETSTLPKHPFKAKILPKIQGLEWSFLGREWLKSHVTSAIESFHSISFHLIFACRKTPIHQYLPSLMPWGLEGRLIFLGGEVHVSKVRLMLWQIWLNPYRQQLSSSPDIGCLQCLQSKLSDQISLPKFCKGFKGSATAGPVADGLPKNCLSQHQKLI
eukprot:204169-Pelagomonas_calceolata.AAC.1